MRILKPQLAVTMAGGAILALVVTLVVRYGVVNVLMMFLVAALAGIYLLRHYAHAERVYLRRLDRRRPAPRPEPESTGNGTPRMAELVNVPTTRNPTPDPR